MHAASRSRWWPVVAASLERPHRPDRAMTLTALRGGLGAGLATWIADVAGIPDPYWAGISAIVVAAPTVGANLGASLSRVLATFAGLGLGLAAHAAGGTGALAGGIVAAVALLVLPAAGLAVASRLGAATTLLVTVAAASDDLGFALARGLAIPLGCGVAIVLGLFVVPARAGSGLRRRLGANVAAAGALVRDAVASYTGGGGGGDLGARLDALRRARRQHLALLADASHELGEDAASLHEGIVAAARLVDAAADLVTVARERGAEGPPATVAAPLREAAERLGALAGSYGADAPAAELPALDASLSDLDAALEQARARRELAASPTAELVRVLTAVSALRAGAAALRTLCGPATGR